MGPLCVTETAWHAGLFGMQKLCFFTPALPSSLDGGNFRKFGANLASRPSQTPEPHGDKRRLGVRKNVPKTSPRRLPDAQLTKPKHHAVVVFPMRQCRGLTKLPQRGW